MPVPDPDETMEEFIHKHLHRIVTEEGLSPSHVMKQLKQVFLVVQQGRNLQDEEKLDKELEE